MLGQQKSNFFFQVQVFDDLKHLFHDLRRQSHGRLVEQHHAGVGHQGATNGAHLLLAARRIGRLAGAPRLESRKVGVDLFQIRVYFGLVFAGVAAGQQVFFDGQVGKAVTPLHHLHHAALHQIGGRQVLNAFAAQFDAAFGDRAALTGQQVADRPQGRGFARAVAAQDGHNLALWHLQRHALEHQNHMVVNNLDAVDIENDVVGVHRFLSFTLAQGHALRMGFFSNRQRCAQGCRLDCGKRPLPPAAGSD